jgi:general secretion pathway protein L
MITCFLFIQQFDDERYLSLGLNEHGDAVVPLERRSIDELKSLQVNARILVVLPTEVSSLHELELPKLSERKARVVIPYAVEEQVAQPVTTLHFAFNQSQEINPRYLVAVIDKTLLSNIMMRLQAAQLMFDIITLDWFALEANEACVTETSLLVNNPIFKGALSLDLASVYLRDHSQVTQIYLFNDSPPIQDLTTVHPIDSSSYLWIAKKLLNKPQVLNLCQGELQYNARPKASKSWYVAASVFAGVWFLSWLGSKVFIAYHLTQQSAALDQKIAVIYHDFFPQAKQVISPKFRITQLLKEGGKGNESAFWLLDNKLTQAVDNMPLKIQQMRFQNQILFITVATQDFAMLEKLQKRLQQNNVHVHQTEAATREQQVIATLELSL